MNTSNNQSKPTARDRNKINQPDPASSELNDELFIRQFEDKTLAASHFDHRGHLRIAWLYLNRYPLNEAVDLVCQGISAYAASLGAADKFNVTVTDALVRIMAVRIEKMHHRHWWKFLEANSDLVENALAVIHQHYSAGLLASEQARLEVLLPDIKAIKAIKAI